MADKKMGMPKSKMMGGAKGGMKGMMPKAAKAGMAKEKKGDAKMMGGARKMMGGAAKAMMPKMKGKSGY